MAEQAKSKKDEGVLAGLPATRPNRLGRRSRAAGPSVEAAREAASRAADTREATGSRASGKRATAADKTRKPAARKKPTAAASAKADAKAKAPAAAKATAKTPAAKPRRAAAKPKPAPQPEVATISEAPRPASKPRAVRSGSPALADVEARRPDEVPAARPAQGPTELVTTVVQAAGELASIGVTIGGQILRRAADKLPKP